MATGTIYTGHNVEDIPITIDTSKITLPTWGSAQAKRIGNIIYVRLYGVIPQAAMSSATIVATYTGPACKAPAMSPLITSTGVEGRCGCDAGYNQIYFSGVTNLGNRFVSLVIPV